MIRIGLILFFITLSNVLMSQIKWTQKPFSQKNFIENNGQVKFSDDIKEPVLYFTNLDGYNYYFTANGVYIGKYFYRKTKGKPFMWIRKKKENEKEEENETRPEKFEKIVEFRFLNTQVNLDVVPQGKKDHFYAYSVLRGSKAESVRARAFKKIVYKNIYDKIDLVFEIPDDSIGLKYAFHVLPGGDPSHIEMELPGKGILNLAGNIVMNTDIGEFTDHSPIVFFETSKKRVETKFQLIGDKKLKFKGSKTNNSNEVLIIDPWLIPTDYTGGKNRAFDVDYDSQGNVYAYGMGASHCELAKYDAVGALVWVFTVSIFTGYDQYGDFAIDRTSDRIYIVEGFGIAGAQILKINSSAITEAIYPGTTDFLEMWRIAFSDCSKQAVVCGGGVDFTLPVQTAYIDTSLTSLTLVSYASGSPHALDAGLLAVDDLGNAYEYVVRSALGSDPGDTTFQNRLVKLPLPTMSPTTYVRHTAHNFVEILSNVYYYPDIFSYYSVGYNGLATSGNKVYSYDATKLFKWDGDLGVVLNSKNISAPPAVSYAKFWGGISADRCENVFIGDSIYARLLNDTLSQITSYTLPSFVYDLKYDQNGTLYACGNDFVTAIDVSGDVPSCSVVMNVDLFVNDSCGTLPMAIANVTGGINPVVEWNTTPPTFNDTLIGVPPGEYIVTITQGNCESSKFTDTIQLTGLLAFLPTYTITQPVCPSNSFSSSITVNTSGGSSPFNYYWSGGLPNSNYVTGLTGGTYTVTIVSADSCMMDLIIPIVPVSPFAITATNVALDCYKPNSGSITVVATGGTLPYNYNWVGYPLADTNILSGLANGLYSVAVTDSNNCVATSQASIEGIGNGSLENFESVNIFTPNNDGQNDVYFPFAEFVDPNIIVEEYKFQIFNRWGVKLFETMSINEGWNGTSNSKRLVEGVYYYIIEGVDYCTGNKVIKKGSVQLSR